jgi:zinc/manganese transport system permease protein
MGFYFLRYIWFRRYKFGAVAGVLLVFSYLVVPAVCAMFFVRGVMGRLLIGWGLGFAASVLGLYASAKWDLPTGASVVTVFGIILAVCAGAKFAANIMIRRHQTVDNSPLPD